MSPTSLASISRDWRLHVSTPHKIIAVHPCVKPSPSSRWNENNLQAFQVYTHCWIITYFQQLGDETVQNNANFSFEKSFMSNLYYFSAETVIVCFCALTSCSRSQFFLCPLVLTLILPFSFTLFYAVTECHGIRHCQTNKSSLLTDKERYSG